MSNSGTVKPKTITSFRKTTNELNQIPGTRVSYHNAQLLTSTGVSSLDYYLGGGLPVGTVLLVEEDAYNVYSNVLLKYFISEGISNDHNILLASGDIHPEKLLSELPSVAIHEPKVHLPDDDQLKIAWRYKGQKSIPESFASFGHVFDLSKTMPFEQLKMEKISTWNVLDHVSQESSSNFMPDTYLSLLSQIKSTIYNKHFKTTEKTCDSIFRIAIASLGSPLWSQQNLSDDSLTALLKFLYTLRSLLRTSYSVAIVTMKSIFLEDETLITKVLQMCDFAIKLESFVGTEKNQNIMYKDFDGLLQVEKLSSLNTHIYQIPIADLAFKLKRKQFLIERLHLPPDIQESTESTIACGSSQSKLLDF